MGAYRGSYPCRECRHDKGRCVGHVRTGAHKNCFEEKPQTNADAILSNVEDVDCLAELIWHDCWGEIFNIPEFSTKQELLDWLRQPKEDA